MAFALCKRVWIVLALLLGCIDLASGQDGDEEVQAGGELVLLYCTDCHTLSRVFRAHYDREGWLEAIGRMEEQGLYVEEDEREPIIEFLLAQRQIESPLSLLGNLHFVLLHFPVVLLVVVALLEFLNKWRGREPSADHIHLLMRLSLLSLLVVVSLGFALVWERETLAPGLLFHRNLGLATLVVAAVATGLRERLVLAVSSGLVWPYRIALALALVLMTLAADRGGALVHGDLAEKAAAVFGG